MADADDKEKQPEAVTEGDKPEGDKKDEKSSGIGILTWVILGVSVLVFAGSGFIIGRLFGGPAAPQTAPSNEAKPTQARKPKKDNRSQTTSQKVWYYELDPVVTNPDEPGATRYVRAALTLEISPELQEDKGKELIESKKPILINWLTIYFKSLTLAEMQNDRDVRRIQLQILDAFNEILFPDARPQIKKILWKEFNIQ